MGDASDLSDEGATSDEGGEGGGDEELGTSDIGSSADEGGDVDCTDTGSNHGGACAWRRLLSH